MKEHEPDLGYADDGPHGLGLLIGRDVGLGTEEEGSCPARKEDCPPDEERERVAAHLVEGAANQRTDRLRCRPAPGKDAKRVAKLLERHHAKDEDLQCDLGAGEEAFVSGLRFGRERGRGKSWDGAPRSPPRT